ncbi:MAG: DUF2975 domain-containing protein [Gammaproteobacteria bacterium]|nr:DUF2975 domain-containing protein [Gammaproteobacteria bacterium]
MEIRSPRRRLARPCHTDLNDPRLRRVLSLSFCLRLMILVLAGGFLLSVVAGTGWAGLEGPSGYRVTVMDFQIRTQGEFAWQDLALFVFWVPVLGIGIAFFYQVDRLLAAYQGGVILDAGNARRISRIGLFIVVICVLLVAGDLLEAALSASLGIPSNERITLEWPWFIAGLVFRAIGYAMGIACEIAEDAELTV